MLSWAAIKLLPWRVIAGIALCAAIVLGLIRWHSQALDRATAAGYASAKGECEKAAREAQEQADARLVAQRFDARAAEERSIADLSDYEQKIRSRQNELRKASASLVECRLSRDLVRVLNDARQDTIGSDRSAPSSSSEPVLSP